MQRLAMARRNTLVIYVDRVADSAVMALDRLVRYMGWNTRFGICRVERVVALRLL